MDAIVATARVQHPCGVRSIAYQLFNRKLIPSMAKEHTRRVSELSVILREEGRIPPEWIDDDTRPEEKVPTWKNPAAFARTVQRVFRLDKWIDQPKRVWVWSEKSVAGTIRPVLDKYEVPFQVLHGFSSATPIWDMVAAILDQPQETVIIYIGDYDPSGMYMSEVDLPKRLARYISSNPSNRDITPEEVRRILKAARLEIRRVALTKADTIALGRAPAFHVSEKEGNEKKKGDSRCPWFREHHGEWCWELDAMAPNVLRDRLERAIRAELDLKAWARSVAVEKVERKAIIATCRSWNSIISGQDQK
jgi:hypothetical protein